MNSIGTDEQFGLLGVAAGTGFMGQSLKNFTATFSPI